MSSKEQQRLFGDGKVDNSDITVDNATSKVTYDFFNSGTDTDTSLLAISVYYNLGRPAYAVNIRPTGGAVYITKINGITLKNPILVQVTGFTVKQGIPFSSLTIQTLVNSTNLKVLAF